MLLVRAFTSCHGFGLSGKVDRWQQFAIVLIIWTFQLIVSPM
jgi:uncharacterized membrane protein YeiB